MNVEVSLSSSTLNLESHNDRNDNLMRNKIVLSNSNLGSVRISRVPVVIGRSLFLYMDILSNSSKMLVSIDQTYNRGFMSTKLIVLILENQYAHCPFIGTGVDLS